jgi:ureidoglycolate hydrolase
MSICGVAPLCEIILRATALTAATFAAFGEVIEAKGRALEPHPISDQGVNTRRNTWQHALVARGWNGEKVAVDDVELATLRRDLE